MSLTINPAPIREPFFINGNLHPAWVQWFITQGIIRNPVITDGLTNAANDAAAAAAGVEVNGLYRNGSIVMIRVS